MFPGFPGPAHRCAIPLVDLPTSWTASGWRRPKPPRPEPCMTRRAPSAPRPSSPACWPAPRSPASAASWPACVRAMGLGRRCAPPSGRLSGPQDQQPAKTSLAHLRGAPQPLLAAAGVLARRKPQPGREVPTAPEGRRRRRKRHHRRCGDRPDAGDGHQPPRTMPARRKADQRGNRLPASRLGHRL